MNYTYEYTFYGFTIELFLVFIMFLMFLFNLICFLLVYLKMKEISRKIGG